MDDGSTPAVPATVREGAPSLVLTFSTRPVCSVLSASVQVTVRPIRPTALDTARDSAMWPLVSARLVSCSTVESCDIWATIWSLSIGLIGSCSCSWVTKSFMKSSLPRRLFGFTADVVGWMPPAVGLVVGIVVMGSRGSGGSGEDVDEQPAGQLEDAVDGLGDVGGRARSPGSGAVRGALAGALTRTPARASLAAVLAGRRDLERDEVHVARGERAAEVVAGLCQQPGGLGGVGNEAGRDAPRRGGELDLDAP